MCLLIVEVLMLIAGLGAIFTGKLPESLFKLLFGKGEYHTDPQSARLFGLLLATPLPLAFAAGLLLGILFGPDVGLYATLLEILIVVTVGIVSIIAARKIKNKPSDQILP
jgi:hypothetical protein